ncbi:MAG: site-specific integrase [Anaerolineae bacterium]|nr:site-specific integrase [Anaerolineae bacterium]
MPNKPEGQRHSVVVERRSTKKAEPTLLTISQADELKTVQNSSPQACRDALLICLLLDHGLRASEVALLTVRNFDQAQGTFTFFRPKVKGTVHEWTTHAMTYATQQLLTQYLDLHYPPDLRSMVD